MKTARANLLMTRCRGGACPRPLHFGSREASAYNATGSLSVLTLLGIFVVFASASAQRPKAKRIPTTVPFVVVTITTEPNAIVWIDEVRRGQTDSSGKLELKNISAQRHLVRIRAMGFRESTTPLIGGKRTLSVKLLRTTDQAELLFQQAEDAREKAKDDEAKQKAAALYREALKLRPALPAAHLGLARVLLDLNEYQSALSEIDAARRTRPVYAEASAVEGRINREAAFIEDAINSFRRSIREGNGFQPEAHVGLARVYEDKGQYAEAIAEFRKAIDQLSDSEPVIFQLLGAAYERAQNYKAAVVAYEKYLQLAPNGSLAPALRSIIDQLRRDAAGQEIVP